MHAAELLKLILTSADNIAVNGTGNGWSKSFVMDHRKNYGAELKLASSGAINVKVELEQSNTELTAAEEGLTHADWVVPSDASAIISAITTNAVHLASLPAVVARYGRLKFTGISGNHTSTVVNRAQVAVLEVG